MADANTVSVEFALTATRIFVNILSTFQ
jgi:hypothetical protein